MAATGALLFASAGAVKADTIVYIFTGDGSWTLNGVAESGDFTVTLFGDPTAVTFSGGEYFNAVTGNFASGGSTVTLTGGLNEVLDNTASPGYAGFGQITIVPTFNVAVESLTGTPFETYNLATTLPLTSGGLSTGPATYFTSGGNLVFASSDSITSLSFQAIVPEPSTWAMMLVGFAGLGFLAYRKRSAPGRLTTSRPTDPNCEKAASVGRPFSCALVVWKPRQNSSRRYDQL